MKISLEWLSEYLPQLPAVETAVEALTQGGFPVESVETQTGLAHPDGNPSIAPDTVIDVEVTSNRGDCLSHIGVARELAALLNLPFNDVQPKANQINAAASSITSVRIESPDLCPHYTARVLRNVKIQPSPAWMQRRLSSIGVRPINNVVDVTNYVMFEMGQPLHAFDFDRLAGHRIIVREAKAGEKIKSIDGHERILSPGMLVIADAERPVALAGVMGGLETEVSASTINILLESARFDPLSVRKTARALAMKSDSSYRFERGIDSTLPERASLRAAQLILETAGGELIGGIAKAGASGYEPKQLSLRLAKLKRVLGIEIPTPIVLDALTRLRMSPILRDDRIDVTVPSFRLDINLEIDLVEEAARVVGYEKIPVRDEIAIRLAPPDPEARTIGAARDILVAGGYFEAVTFTFVSDQLAGDFLPPQAKSLPRTDAAVRKVDADLRPSLLPGLLEAVRRNEMAGTPGARLYEIGSTFWNDAVGKIEERRRIGLVGGGDLREMRGVVESILIKLDAERRIEIIPDTRAGFAPNACGRIEWNGQTIGHLGRIDRAIADKLSLRDPPAAAEIELSALLSGAQPVPILQPLPRFPAIRRDLSLIVSENTRYERLGSLIRQLQLPSLEDFEHVTTYRGKPMEKGQKSMTITLIFRSPSETLTSEAVEGSVQRIIEAAKGQLGASLRV